MTIRANADSRFLLKYLLIGVGCLAFGLWAVYDGFVSYPKELEKAKILKDLKAENEDATVWQNRWKEVAIEKGWVVQVRSNDRPDGLETIAEKRPSKTPEEIEHNIVWQYIFIGLGVLIGVPCLVWYLRNRGTWVELTKNGITSSWGQEVLFDQISQFDKKIWEKKGIAVLTYETPQGTQKFVVDDLKYCRKPMDEIVCLIESKIPREMIVNGEPEPPPPPKDNSAPDTKELEDTEVDES